MRMEKIRLKTKACPFCGSEDIYMSHSWFDEMDTREYHMFSVTCQNCLAMTAQKANAEGAIGAWERRAGHDQD